MGVWGYIALFSVGIAAFILILAGVLSLSIAFAARRFSHTVPQKRIAEMERLLPGKNCGKCGCATCGEYAQAVFTCRMDPDRCTEGGPELPVQLDACMKKFEKLLEREEKKPDI